MQFHATNGWGGAGDQFLANEDTRTYPTLMDALGHFIMGRTNGDTTVLRIVTSEGETIWLHSDCEYRDPYNYGEPFGELGQWCPQGKWDSPVAVDRDECRRRMEKNRREWEALKDQ
jgi:hypothetical protein